MNFMTRHFKLVLVSLLISVPMMFFAGCGRGTISEKTFVGKWKSSKLETPVYLYDNGEWEIKTESGGVLQYGVWDYKAGTITWSYKAGSNVGHDANAVLSATPQEFHVREGDGTTTTFSRLE